MLTYKRLEFEVFTENFIPHVDSTENPKGVYDWLFKLKSFISVLNLKCSTQAFIDVERCKILNFSTQSTSGLSQNKPFDSLSYQLSNGDMCKFHKASLKITIVCWTTPNKYYYTFKLHFSFLLGQHTPVNSQCLPAVASFPSNTVHYWMELCKKNIIGCWWRHYIKVRENYKITKFCKINCTSLFTATLCLHLSTVLLLWMYNKTVNGFGMGMISRIIQTEVNVIRLSLWHITLTSVWIILDIMRKLNGLLLYSNYINQCECGDFVSAMITANKNQLYHT